MTWRFHGGRAAARLVGALVAVATLSGCSAASPTPQALAAQHEATMLADPLPRGVDPFAAPATGSQITYLDLTTGRHRGTANERFARPGLSLVKLYIAAYVLDHGTPKEQAHAVRMVRTSDDNLAAQLFEAYPHSIDSIAEDYHLYSTRAETTWGGTVTSTYDVCLFLAQKLAEDPDSELITAMRTPAPVAADGYRQNFGTSTLPGVRGTKWGWSNDRRLHSSVSFGDHFVVATSISGSADDLTDLAQTQVKALVQPS